MPNVTNIVNARKYMRERNAMVLSIIETKLPLMVKFHADLMVGTIVADDTTVLKLQELEVPFYAQSINMSNDVSPKVSNYEKLFAECEALFIEAVGYVRKAPSMEDMLIEAYDNAANQRSAAVEEASNLRQLANVGLALEIGGHDMYYMVTEVKSLINKILDKDLSQKLLDAFQTMTDNFNGWYEMKASSNKYGGYVTGKEIFDFVNGRMGHHLVRDKVKFTATKQFLNMKVYCSRSVMFAVFMNLVGNASYWVLKGSAPQKEILLSYVADKNDATKGIAYVSDNGNGVADNKVDHLFTPFFSERPHGGRGIGLVMIKKNLEARGFGLFYSNNKILPGANFAVSLIGVS